MSYKFIKREVSYRQPILPSGAYYYKTQNNKKIYKNKYIKEFYIVYKDNFGQYVVEYYVGDCQC